MHKKASRTKNCATQAESEILFTLQWCNAEWFSKTLVTIILSSCDIIRTHTHAHTQCAINTLNRLNDLLGELKYFRPVGQCSVSRLAL